MAKITADKSCITCRGAQAAGPDDLKNVRKFDPTAFNDVPLDIIYFCGARGCYVRGDRPCRYADSYERDPDAAATKVVNDETRSDGDNGKEIDDDGGARGARRNPR